MENVVTEFLSESNLSADIAIDILDNVKSNAKAKIIFNLTQMDFDFANKNVTISYYVIDDNYPDVVLSFDELTKLLKAKYSLIKKSGKYNAF